MSNNQLATVTYEIAGQTIELQPETVKNYLVRGNGNVTDQEVVMFMNLCQYQQLNPFINEAYLIKFGNQPAQTVVGKEAFMKRAESHDEYNGLEAGIIYEIDGEMKDVVGAVKPKNAALLGGWCKVYREDRERPIEVRVSLEEFGKGQATWKEMPNNMIRKVAIVNALREAFPKSLGAMYTEEETQRSAVDEVPDYRERKDITPNQEVVDKQEPSNNGDQEKLDAAKAEMKGKFKILGITTKKAIQEYLDQHAPNMSKTPTLAEIIGLNELLDMHIDMQEMNAANDDQLE